MIPATDAGNNKLKTFTPSKLTKVAFPCVIFTTIAVIFLIAQLAGTTPWIWMSLMLPTLLHGWIENERQRLHAATVGILDDLAPEFKLMKFSPSPPNGVACLRR